MIVAFMGGIVSNIYKKKRRGVIGFFCAGVVSVFCGGVAGMCSSGLGTSTQGQVFIAAIIGVASDLILTKLLCPDTAAIVHGNVSVNNSTNFNESVKNASIGSGSIESNEKN